MPRVIVIAEVEDAAKWEEGFRTHADLLRKQTCTAAHYTVTDDNRVVCCFEPTDLDKYLEVFGSPETAEAMSYDGVKRETALVFTLDKELPL